MKPPQFVREHPYLSAAGAAILAGLIAKSCDSKKVDPPASSPVELEETQKGVRSKIKDAGRTRGDDPSHTTDLNNGRVILERDERGWVDLSKGGLIVPLQDCIQEEWDAVCENPGSIEMLCITTRQEGGVPVYFETPYSSGRTEYIKHPEEDRVAPLYVGRSAVSYKFNITDPEATEQSLTEMCHEVRQWLNTNIEDLDRAKICKDLTPEDCDRYLDKLKIKGSGGYEIKQASNDLGDALDAAGIKYHAKDLTRFYVTMNVSDVSGDSDIFVSIVRNEDGTVGYLPHSVRFGSDLSQPASSDPQTVLDRIQSEKEWIQKNAQ